MSETLYSFASGGLLALPIWAIVLIVLIMTQITVLAVTLYLHRCQAHRGVDLHPIVSHPMRLWLWMSTGMKTKEWVAVHRKHHAHCETEQDPHSPQTHGISKVMLSGAELYRAEADNHDTLDHYGHGCPNDWVERKVYEHRLVGPALMLLLDVAVFGAIGITVWAVQMMWIPFFAAGVINGLGHWCGYRNFVTEDTSRNIVPWGLFLGGEELHNNHHAFPSSARFALRRWELDLGWALLSVLSKLRLAKVQRVAPQLRHEGQSAELCRDALRAVFIHRFEVMKNYCSKVIRPAVTAEIADAGRSLRRMRRRARNLLTGNEKFFNASKQEQVGEILDQSDVLSVVYGFRQRLQQLWDRSTTDPEQLLANLKQWCREAEATGIRVLQEFARSLSGYRLRGAAEA